MKHKLKTVLSILLPIVCLICSMLIICWMGLRVGTASETKPLPASTTDIIRRFDAFVGSATSNALGGIVPASAAEALAAVEKEYFLDRSQTVVPEPNQAFFRKTTNPSEIDLAIEVSQELLDGQDVFWDPTHEIMSGSVINYYMDETILVINWKEVINNVCYTFTEVKIMDASQFRRYLADDTFGSSMQYRPSEMAATVNAVVASNGDFYKHRPDGIIIYKGEVFRVHGYINQTLHVDMNGDFHFTYEGEIVTEDQAKAYIEENNIDFSLSFGPVLIDHGENVNPPSYFLGEPLHPYARSAICQLDTLHYLLVHVNEENNHRNVPKMASLAEVLHSRGGIQMAYALDGGQTGTVVINDKVINRVVYNNERTMSDIIYFNTAIPDEEEAGS